MSDRPYLSYLADLGSKLALPKIQESLKSITTGKERDGYLNALANNLNARSDSWTAAAKNIRNAIDALQTAETALLEMATLSTRLEELGALYNNNSLLTTSDIAALNAETESITAAVDSMVTATTFNGKSLLGTSKVSLNVGTTDLGNIQTVTAGTVSSIASTTEASNADTTGAALTAEITLNLGEISGGLTTLQARENVAYAASAIMSVASINTVESNIAAETAELTKQMMLNKVSTSLLAQANLNENTKLNLIS
ncbi:MAG: hypothetical protein CBC22_07085 [Alphaproteobacteria bacterium TMED62]|nr:MAG: hypothetical protein CBC22_07085 [Alphaproteobacteria bacterium TMED62]